MTLLSDLYKKVAPVARKVVDFTTGIPTVANASADALVSRIQQPQIDAQNAASRAMDNNLQNAINTERARGNVARVQQLQKLQGTGTTSIENNINRQLTTPEQARQGFTSLAGLATMGLGTEVKALQAAKPLTKFLGYGAVRGAENALPGVAVNAFSGTSAKDTLKQAGTDFGTGFALNSIFSPKLAMAAIKGGNPVVKDAIKAVEGVVSNLPKNASGKVKAPATIEQVTKDTVPLAVQKIDPSTAAYIAERANAQKIGKEGIVSKVAGIPGEIQKKFVDTKLPIENLITKSEKAAGYELLPSKNVKYQMQNAIRAPQIAKQYMEDNGLTKIIQNVPNYNEFNQYLIAKHGATVEDFGINTGRNLEKDAKLVAELAPKYQAYAAEVSNYNKNLLNLAVDNGLVSPQVRDELFKKYPDYVPLNRVFKEGENIVNNAPSGKAVSSLSKQTVVQKLKGSNREVVNPLESMMVNTQRAIKQIELNKSAQMLTSYEKLPGNPFQLRKLASTEKATGKDTVSVFRNGVKEVYQTTPEIAAAAKSLDVPQLSLLEKIFSVPTRVLQAGTTALNVPFVARNLVKDQGTTFFNSKNPLSTSIANPKNFLAAMYEAIGHGQVYKDWVRSGGGGTSFDLLRDASNTAAKVRSQANKGSSILYTATHPNDLLTTFEDVIGKSEELTRIQNFKGTYDALIKQGRTPADAKILAADASRMATANFANKGEWSRTVSAVIPFFNAGVQGARSLTNAARSNPKAFAAKLGVGLFIPTTAAVAWNLSDPARAKAYQDILDYEKDNNLILILDPTPNDKGQYRSVKIPMAPGYSNIASVFRRQLESMAGFDNQSFRQIADDLINATTSINPEPSKLISQFTPSLIKPGVESATNTNLFTGAPIVSQEYQNLPPELQYNDKTSLTARKIANIFGASPLKTENTIRTAFGGVGNQLVNLSDRLMGAPSPGGESITSNLERSFSLAAGGKQKQLEYQKQDIQNRIRAIEKQQAEGKITPDQSKKLIDEQIRQIPLPNNGFVVSPDAPKNVKETLQLYAKGIITDPINTVEAIFTNERLRKINGNTAVFERRNGVGTLDSGNTNTQIDHIVPLALGGSNDPSNLQILSAQDNNKKSQLEVDLMKKVASGEISKADAQRKIQEYSNSIPTTPVQQSDYSGKVTQSKADGRFFFVENGKTRSYNTQAQANEAYARSLVQSGKSKSETVNGKTFVSDGKGGVKTYDLAKVSSNTEQAKLTSDIYNAKSANDFATWKKLQNKKIEDLRVKAESYDKTFEMDKIIAAARQAQAIKSTIDKYSKYGGFVKPKKAKKIKMPSVRAKISTPKSTYKVVKPKLSKVSLKQPKIKLAKKPVKLPK